MVGDEKVRKEHHLQRKQHVQGSCGKRRQSTLEDLGRGQSGWNRTLEGQVKVTHL